METRSVIFLISILYYYLFLKESELTCFFPVFCFWVMDLTTLYDTVGDCSIFPDIINGYVGDFIMPDSEIMFIIPNPDDLFHFVPSLKISTVANNVSNSITVKVILMIDKPRLLECKLSVWLKLL